MRIKRLIMETLPFSQKGRSIDSIYKDVSRDIRAWGVEDLSKERFLNALSELDKEQSLVILGTDDIRGTNFGFNKYNCV